MSPLLQVAKIAITHLSLGHKTKKNFLRASKFIGTIYEKSVAVVVLEKSA